MWSYLQKAQLVQEAAQIGDNFGASYKLLPYVVIKNQIQVTLAIPCFLWDNETRPVKKTTQIQTFPLKVFLISTKTNVTKSIVKKHLFFWNVFLKKSVFVTL